MISLGRTVLKIFSKYEAFFKFHNALLDYNWYSTKPVGKTLGDSEPGRFTYGVNEMARRMAYTDETKEIARARVAAGEAISRVAKDMGISKSTLHGWITAEDKESSQEVRESRKLRFINKAWDIIDQALDLSSQKIRMATVSTERFEEMIDRLVQLLEARKDLDSRQIGDIVRQLSKVMDISLPDISTFTGTLFDKQAKASGEEDARFVFEIKGEGDYLLLSRALEGLSEHAKREVVDSIRRIREEAHPAH